MQNNSFLCAKAAAWAAMLSVVVGCTFDPKPTQSVGSGEKKASPPGEEAPRDEVQVRGHWICVAYSEGGQKAPAAEIHALFTDKEVKLSYAWGAAVYEYHFDPQSHPKHCDLTNPRQPWFSCRAIYSLENGTLRLCTPMVVNKNTPYPTSLEPGKGNVAYTFKRVEKEARIDEASLSAQQKDALARSARRWPKTSNVWREKSTRSSWNILAPRKFAMRSSNASRGSKKSSRTWSNGHRRSLNCCEFCVPKCRNSIPMRVARRMICAIHVNGLPPLPAMTLVKAGDRWYAEEPGRKTDRKTGNH